MDQSTYSRSASPITQILYINIPPDRNLKDTTTYHGRLWAAALNLIEQSEGFSRLYWGRSLENPENVQLHIVRATLQHHQAFNKSDAKYKFNALLQTIASSGSKNPIVAVRHAALKDFTPNSKALGRGAPFTGTAIYLRPSAAWHEGAWPLWTHIVRYIDGCEGCSGGMILDPVDCLTEPVLVGGVKPVEKGDKWEAYLVYVGWETVEKHEHYHHTKHFAQHRVILGCGNAGYGEYGHIVFEGERVSNTNGARL